MPYNRGGRGEPKDSPSVCSCCKFFLNAFGFKKPISPAQNTPCVPLRGDTIPVQTSGYLFSAFLNQPHTHCQQMNTSCSYTETSYKLLKFYVMLSCCDDCFLPFGEKSSVPENCRRECGEIHWALSIFKVHWRLPNPRFYVRKSLECPLLLCSPQLCCTMQISWSPKTV